MSSRFIEALSPHSKKIPSISVFNSPAGVVKTFSVWCLCGFSLDALLSSHSLKPAARLTEHTKTIRWIVMFMCCVFKKEFICVWFLFIGLGNSFGKYKMGSIKFSDLKDGVCLTCLCQILLTCQSVHTKPLSKQDWKNRFWLSK